VLQSLIGLERARPRAAHFVLHHPQPTAACGIDVVHLPRSRHEHGGHALRSEQVLPRRVRLRLVGEHQQRTGERRQRRRAPPVGLMHLDVIGIVTPDHVVERVVLREPAVAKAVVA